MSAIAKRAGRASRWIMSMGMICAFAMPVAAKPTLVLVHGAFADPHAFDAVRPRLEAAGFKVVTPLLPGHGSDTTDAHAITLERYVAPVKAAVMAEAEPVVLLGHSMAGMVVSQVAEEVPERIAVLAFVAGYLPQSGQNLQGLAAWDSTSLVGKALRFAPDYSTASLDPALAGQAIAGDAPVEVQAFIARSQRPEPLAPFGDVVTLTPERFGRVSKVYLQTTLDRAVTPALQARMLAATPHVRTRSIAAAHLPFVTQPEAFADWLLKVARTTKHERGAR